MKGDFFCKITAESNAVTINFKHLHLDHIEQRNHLEPKVVKSTESLNSNLKLHVVSDVGKSI